MSGAETTVLQANPIKNDLLIFMEVQKILMTFESYYLDSKLHFLFLITRDPFMKGYMYILLCSNGLYYTGSTNNLERRMNEHWCGQGPNYTKKHPPVELLYVEEFQRIDQAFYREKQIQGWSRAKKEALIARDTNQLHLLSSRSLLSKFQVKIK
ncbi:MAG: GIY-YIG nuclease family protein [Bacteroidales bacterium]|nr:GIY-YIG nuclease family protein [Bacteroidales bacterium]